jgi:transcriptional regulator with GAF, ATPase, and Fis domain
MTIDSTESESVGFGCRHLDPAGPSVACTTEAAGGTHRQSLLRERLRRLSAERLVEILIALADRQGREVELLVDDALRKGADAAAPTQAPAVAPRSGPLLDAPRLRATLDRHGHNVTGAARALGVSRMTIYRSMRRYGIT